MIVLLSGCFGKIKETDNQMKFVDSGKVMMSKIDFISPVNLNFDEQSVLNELNLAFKGIPGDRFPKSNENQIVYNFFPDLENGYMFIASSKIHLYADKNRWAIVFETNGYHNRQFNAQINLVYIGNCISYSKEISPERSYVSNFSSVELISQEEFKRIQNFKGLEMEQFELVDSDINEIKVRDVLLPVNHNGLEYEAFDIKFREYDNPKRLVGFKDLVRFLSETQKEVMSANEEDLRKNLPDTLPKLITIDSFHHKNNMTPDSYETYRMIAKILVTGDTTFWKPKLTPNNHWTNWRSGAL
ncbi:DUF7003 family protein [Sporocytophaga myxococcoides]|uniref:DUF7003 family protein n=1 Tax=Sporocytophaga myxococcoides TaxID=153721 RepID=UPI00138AF22C|nr:hypothetical protein [Sporocytophaga myxococcoides]